MFVALNDQRLEVTADEAVDQMLAIAAGKVDEVSMQEWLSGRLQ